MRNDAENRSFYLGEGVGGAGTDELILIDVLLTASPAKIEALRAEWKHSHPLISMDTRIKLETKGDLQRIFEAVIHDQRPHSGISEDKLQDDIDALHAATEGKLGTDEKAIAALVATRSSQHLQTLDEMFRKKSKRGKSFVEVLRSEMSGDDELAFSAAFLSAHEWHAYRLHLAMKGLGTDEESLVRALLLAGEAEIRAAAVVIQKQHDYSLAEKCKKELSGELAQIIGAYVDFCCK